MDEGDEQLRLELPKTHEDAVVATLTFNTDPAVRQVGVPLPLSLCVYVPLLQVVALTSCPMVIFR